MHIKLRCPSDEYLLKTWGITFHSSWPFCMQKNKNLRWEYHESTCFVLGRTLSGKSPHLRFQWIDLVMLCSKYNLRCVFSFFRRFSMQTLIHPRWFWIVLLSPFWPDLFVFDHRRGIMALRYALNFMVARLQVTIYTHIVSYLFTIQCNEVFRLLVELLLFFSWKVLLQHFIEALDKILKKVCICFAFLLSMIFDISGFYCLYSMI